jgi:hypothetical protein
MQKSNLGYNQSLLSIFPPLISYTITHADNLYPNLFKLAHGLCIVCSYDLPSSDGRCLSVCLCTPRVSCVAASLGEPSGSAVKDKFQEHQRKAAHLTV